MPASVCNTVHFLFINRVAILLSIIFCLSQRVAAGQDSIKVKKDKEDRWGNKVIRNAWLMAQKDPDSTVRGQPSEVIFSRYAGKIIRRIETDQLPYGRNLYDTTKIVTRIQYKLQK